MLIVGGILKAYVKVKRVSEQSAWRWMANASADGTTMPLRLPRKFAGGGVVAAPPVLTRRARRAANFSTRAITCCGFRSRHMGCCMRWAAASIDVRDSILPAG